MTVGLTAPGAHRLPVLWLRKGGFMAIAVVSNANGTAPSSDTSVGAETIVGDLTRQIRRLEQVQNDTFAHNPEVALSQLVADLRAGFEPPLPLGPVLTRSLLKK